MMRRITDEQAQGATGPQKVLKKSLTITLGWDCYFTWSSKPCESLAVWRTKEVPSFLNYYFWNPAHWFGPGKRTFDLHPVVMCSANWANPAAVKGFVIETLTLRYFGISREPRTSRSHVSKALSSGLRFQVHVCTARPRSRSKWFIARFLHPKTSQTYVWEEIRLFRTLLLNDCRILFQKNVIFEDSFSAKIEVSGWMKTNMAAASYHPRILSPKYGQTGKVKPLTAKRSLSFAVKWPNLDPTFSNIY